MMSEEGGDGMSVKLMVDMQNEISERCARRRTGRYSSQGRKGGGGRHVKCNFFVGFKHGVVTY